MPDLTERQHLALELVSRGFATKEIAAHMSISEAGAKKHIDTLRRRYSAPNRAQLIRRAIELGELRVVSQASEDIERSTFVGNEVRIGVLSTFTSVHDATSSLSPEPDSTVKSRRAQQMATTEMLALEIRVPPEYVEIVSRDLRNRGGSVLEVKPGMDGTPRIIGQIPATLLPQYGAELRQLTAGRATFDAHPPVAH